MHSCIPALKSGVLYRVRGKKVKDIPPKVHNLVYLLNRIGIKPSEEMGKFMVKLNEANVVTRYPDNIDKLQKDYTEGTVKEILRKSKESLKWIKEQF